MTADGRVGTRPRLHHRHLRHHRLARMHGEVARRRRPYGGHLGDAPRAPSPAAGKSVRASKCERAVDHRSERAGEPDVVARVQRPNGRERMELGRRTGAVPSAEVDEDVHRGAHVDAHGARRAERDLDMIGDVAGGRDVQAS